MSAPIRATVTTPSDREIRIERIFNAPRDRVWKVMTDPALVAQWWGRGNKLVIERMEVERGGHWRFVEHSDHGVHGFEGRYREVVPPERIVQTFEWDGRAMSPWKPPRWKIWVMVARDSSTPRCSTAPKSGTACWDRAWRTA